MYQYLSFRRSLTALAVVGCLALSATSVQAARKSHDASSKARVKAVDYSAPRGTFGSGIRLPKTVSSASPFASEADQARGAVNFNVVSGGPSRAPQVPMRVDPVMPLRACVTYDIDNKSYGMVNVTANGLEVLREHEGLEAGWGGTGVGTKYYYNTCADVSGGVVNSVETYLWDTSNWQCIGYDQDPSLDVLSYSMTCHPVTEVVYGCFFSADLQSIEIGTLDPMTMKRTGVIGKTEHPLYAMGFSSDGTLYGIDAAGVLYTVSLTDAKYTKVAETGITTRYNTTGTIDSFNDIFYYAACPQGPSGDPSRDWALYSIDLRNGYKVEKCWNLRAELGGMYIANPAAKDAAPAAPELKSVAFDNGSLNGKVTFAAPATTFDGKALSGSLTYGILANGEKIASGNITAGSESSVDVTLSKAGMYTFRVYVSNATGDSPKSESVTAWYGNGKPLAPEGLTASYAYGDSEIAVEWQAVSKALNDGYLDTSKVTYTVSRTIDGGDPVVITDKTSGTTLTDPVGETTGCHVYKYFVTAHHGEQDSDEAATEYLAVGALVPPFAPDFAQRFTEGYFTTRDYLNRGLKWHYSAYDQAMMMLWNAGWGPTNMDVALVTAPVQLKAGQAYEVSYNTWVESNYAHGIGLQWGSDPDNLTTVIEPETVNASNSTWTNPVHQSVIVMPEKDGIYYFSVRVLGTQSPAVKLFVRDFAISKGLSNKAPGQVTDVTFTPPYDGSKKLDIAFTAPAVSIDGKKLTSLSKIEVIRNGELVQTFRNPTFGQKLSFTDSGKTNEDVSYTITAFNTAGQGRSYFETSHMGVNIPVSPENCKIEQDMSNPGVVTITWTPVAKDVNGNEFDPSLLRYAIFASDYQTLIANNITASEAEATFRAISADAGQAFVWYCVVPYTEGGVNGYDGGFGRTPMIPVGTPFKMPYLESFADGLHYPMGQSGASLRIANGVSSQHLTIEAQDGDKGCLALYTAPDGYVNLYSANLTVDDAEDVAMSFYYTGVPDMEGYIISPFVICEGTNEALCDDIDTKDCAEKGWNRVQVSLAKYAGKTIQFAFFIRCINNNFAFGLDNIVLKRYVACDLRAGSVSGPSFMTKGKEHDIIVEVVNEGSDDAPAGYAVDLYADGKLVKSAEGPFVEALTTQAVKFVHTPDPFAKEEEKLHAVIRWDVDELPDNNTSGETAIPLHESVYPAVSDLIATLGSDEKSADLSWSEPDHAPKLKQITESFEDYDPFTIAGFGDWKVYDGDGLETYSVGINYPNCTTPKAWMVVDKSQMQRVYYDLSRTGERAALAVSVRGAADDWLISPELPGIAQKVSFFAAVAPEDFGDESFEFYYSTTGTSTEDFIKMGDTVEVPDGDWVEDEYGDEVQVTTWYEYSYDLPEGAKYFAIRYVSEDIWAMLIDDVTFTISDEVLALKGYNLFRNGTKVNENILTATTHKDDLSEMEPGDYEYAVETVYDKGNSGISNLDKVTVPEPVGIDGVASGDVTVIGEKGFIRVLGADGRNVAVYTPSGIMIHDAVAGAPLRIAVESGVYMVKVGSDVFKVVIP